MQHDMKAMQQNNRIAAGPLYFYVFFTDDEGILTEFNTFKYTVATDGGRMEDFYEEIRSIN